MTIAAYVCRSEFYRELIEQHYGAGDDVHWFIDPDPDGRFPSEQLVAATYAVIHQGYDALVVGHADNIGGVWRQAFIAAIVGPGRFRPIQDAWVWEATADRDPNPVRADARTRMAEVHGWGELRRERTRVLRRRQVGGYGFKATPVNVPYGFQAVRGEVVVDPDARLAIRRGLALRNEGATLAAIGEYWLSIGFHPRPDTRGRKRNSGWDRGTVRKVLAGNAELDPAPLDAGARRFIGGRGGRVARASV